MVLVHAQQATQPSPGSTRDFIISRKDYQDDAHRQKKSAITKLMNKNRCFGAKKMQLNNSFNNVIELSRGGYTCLLTEETNSEEIHQGGGSERMPI
jgi:hypothetical protein